MFYILAGLSQLPRLHSLLILLALCYAVKASSFLIHTFLKLFQNCFVFPVCAIPGRKHGRRRSPGGKLFALSFTQTDCVFFFIKSEAFFLERKTVEKLPALPLVAETVDKCSLCHDFSISCCWEKCLPTKTKNDVLTLFNKLQNFLQNFADSMNHL